MPILRRRFLQATAAFGALLVLPRVLFAAAAGGVRPDAAFEQDTRATALKSLFSSSDITLSDQVVLSVPEIAENGAVVPIGVSSTLADIDTIALLIDGNPNPLTASFEIGPRTVAEISTRVKMAETSAVLAVVRAGGVLYGTESEVKVTIGGCGG